MKTLQEKLKLYRLSQDEYQRISELLGREPRGLEWALFSALWSEHCSYKSSKVILKKFARTMNSSAQGGDQENAGIFDLGEGERIAFKMESHNHPSFIEPYQGAATGVGGILRDIFTMGARPIALADFLCFGDPQNPHMPRLVDGVVRGIAGYGNAVGVPTVTGHTEFDPAYDQNILVNAMAVGYFGSKDPVVSSRAQGPGNDVVYVGAKTGRDGVHGASMASESFGEDNEAKKPNVQIGDPFYEKLLIEACLEVFREGLVVAIQDMGAAGLTSSTFEMAAKGKVGVELWLDEVPLRDSSMDPEEIMLSESQERMLLVSEPRHFAKLKTIFEKWGLDAVKVGQVTSDSQVKIRWKGEWICEIDPQLLVERAPKYERPFQAVPWKGLTTSSSEFSARQWARSLGAVSRRSIYRQYDQRVGAKTVRDASYDVAVLRLPESGRALFVAVGCRPQVMKIHPYLGGIDAVMYPALQMALKGGKALAVTDCLNFADPTRSSIMSDFVASVEGITQAAITMDTPVISGNVSFYNETLGLDQKPKPIIATPATGLIGLRGGVEGLSEDEFQTEGNSVWLISCVQKQFPELRLAELREFRDRLIETHALFVASQMVGIGGLVPSLLKMCSQNKGVKVEENLDSKFSSHVFYSALVEVSPQNEKSLQQAWGSNCLRLGVVQKDRMEWDGHSESTQELHSLREKGLAEHVPSLK